MNDLFEKRYNSLRSEYDIGRVHLQSAVIALEDCAKQVEFASTKDALNQAAHDLKTTMNRMGSVCGYI